MSSAGSALSDSGVLDAFTEAYNDQFRRMMNVAQQSSTPTPPSPVPSSACGSCRQLGGGGIPPIVAQEEVIMTVAPQRGSGAWLWSFVVVILAILGMFWLFKWLCAPKRRYGGGMMPSVESAFNKPSSVSRGDPAVSLISNPADVTKPTSKKALVMFFAEWCGHCKEMKPTFEKLAAASKGKADFWACEHSILEKSGKAAELGIQGYPTVIAFSKGVKANQLVGNVGAEKLAAFINEAVSQ